MKDGIWHACCYIWCCGFVRFRMSYSNGVLCSLFMNWHPIPPRFVFQPRPICTFSVIPLWTFIIHYSAIVKQNFRWEYFILSTNNLVKETEGLRILDLQKFVKAMCSKWWMWFKWKRTTFGLVGNSQIDVPYDNIDVERRPHLVALLESLHKQFHDSGHQTEQSKQLHQGIP